MCSAMGRSIKLLLVGTVLIGMSQQNIPRCLCSRLDFRPCPTEHKPECNQSIHHRTEIIQSATCCECRIRTTTIRTIPNLGTDEMRIIRSPGFKRDGYKNNHLVHYNVCCKAGEQAFFTVTHFDLQEASCDYQGRRWCEDYIQINRNGYGTSRAMCGTVPSPSLLLQLDRGQFTVVFRTSESVTRRGFQMYVLCYRTDENIGNPHPGRALPSNVNQASALSNCFDVSEFNSSASAEGEGEPPQAPSSRGKKSCGKEPRIASFYSQLFPDRGYPPKLRISSDLAAFHEPWRKLIAIPGLVVEVDALYNQTVNYTDSTIIIMDLYGKILARHAVNILWTFDSNGKVQKYVSEVADARNPHFDGGGLMRIAGKHAYFQLFLIDPRGILPNEAEQRELILMNTPMLESNASDEIILEEFNNTDTFDTRDIDTPELGDGDIDAVLAALRSQDSCNPILRAQSRATLTYYNEYLDRMDFVESLRTFNISCFFDGNDALTCISLTNILSERTTCQINNQTPKTCDPFNEPFDIELIPPGGKVTVYAINCVGQTAIEEVFIEPL